MLYHKHRPRRFADVIGQELQMNILKQRVLENCVAHAYLFVGSRGSGKTSTSRILASAVNCENPIDGEPCNECSNCRNIRMECCQDVIELDAASNNGVDHIRELRDNCAYVPASARKKVYIIDEVHMLSKGAFNALLKTLEQPPSHCIFILCTTELHMVPATIRSRCQIFNFNQIGQDDMVAHLEKICAIEGITAETLALQLITRAADGAVRDALSILDKCASLAKDIKASMVSETLGYIDTGFLLHIACALVERDGLGASEGFRSAMRAGRNPLFFVESLSYCFRDLMVAKAGGCLVGYESYKDLTDVLLESATVPEFSAFVRTLCDLRADIGRDQNPSVRVELALINMACRPLENLNEVIAELERVKKQLADLKDGMPVVERRRDFVVVTERILETSNVMNIESLMCSSPVAPKAEITVTSSPEHVSDVVPLTLPLVSEEDSKNMIQDNKETLSEPKEASLFNTVVAESILEVEVHSIDLDKIRTELNEDVLVRTALMDSVLSEVEGVVEISCPIPAFVHLLRIKVPQYKVVLV